MSKSEKFILMHIGSSDSKEFLTDALKNQGVERGLIMNSALNEMITNHFSLIKERGYYPIGMIIDPNTTNVEFLFKRHAHQTEKMKLAEFKNPKPTEI